MTVEEEPETRRIVVAVDASPCGRAALEAAAQWAAEVQAELQTLFVEDDDLVRLANLPMAHEVPLSYAVPRPLAMEGLERVFRAHAEQVRRALAKAAARLQIHWTFQVRRGDLIQTSRAVAGQAELLIVGMAETAGTAPREFPVPAGVILAIDDGTAQSNGVLRIASAFARSQAGNLVVLSRATETGASALRQREICQCLDGCRVGYSIRPLPAVDGRTIVRLAERLRKRLLLLVLRGELLEEAELEILIKQLECPLALVPEGEDWS